MENKIKFITTEFAKDIEDIKPIPAHQHMPNWFKNAPINKVGDITVKGCMPLQDSMTSGYLLRLPQDMIVHYNVMDEVEKKKIIKIDFAMGQHMMQDLSFQQVAENHDPHQVGGTESYLAQENSPKGVCPIPKIISPFKIITPSGWSCLFVPPLHREEDYFRILPAIVDTDTYPQVINFPFIFNRHKYPSFVKKFERGMPYVQVIPFKRNNWKMEVSYEKEFNRGSLNWATKILNRYKSIWWNKKRYR
jgi:hypothetical protein